MPEILEVETYRRQAEAVVGRRIVDVTAPDAWYVKGVRPEDVRHAATGKVVATVRRVGKLLLFDLDEGRRLGLRFGMTGRLIVDGAAAIERLEYASAGANPVWDRFALLFDGGRDLRMRDPRRLGAVLLDPDESLLGVDAFAVTAKDLESALDGSRAPLKARLLDQAHVAGIGNLLADEILWRAGLDSARRSGSLTTGEVQRLEREIGDTLRDLMARGGSHTGDLRAAALSEGRCPRDGVPIERRRIGGRTTLSCPAHQV